VSPLKAIRERVRPALRRLMQVNAEGLRPGVSL
jgi:hypothetical protein